MTYILYFSSLLAGFIFKKSKICTMYIYIVMILLSAFSYQRADYGNYIIGYNRLELIYTNDIRYAGYHFLQKFFKELGLDFQMYCIVFYTICFAILIFSIKLLTKNVNYVLSLYLVYSFSMDVVQMKSLCSEVIAFLGIAILLKYYKKTENARCKRNVIVIGAFLLILAILLHSSAILYLLASVIYLLIGYKKKLIRHMCYILGGVTCFIYLDGVDYILVLLNKLGVVGNMRYIMQWSKKSTEMGWIIPSVLVFCVLIIAAYIQKKDSKIIESQIVIKDFLLTAMLLIPLLVLNVTYIRLIRVYIILMYAMFANIKIQRKMSLKKGLCHLMFIVCVVYGFVYEIFPVYDTTLGAILKYNSIM